MTAQYYKKLCISASLLSALALAHSASADNLGDTQRFFVDRQYSKSGETTLNATLRQVSDHAYFYVEDEYWNNFRLEQKSAALESIQKIAHEFDATIYPTETAAFGSEPNPGIDNDPKITIFLTPLQPTIGGYFDTGNENPTTVEPTSNHREMIYLNIPDLDRGDTAQLRKTYAFLAHEFQHMITFGKKELVYHTADDVWLNELRSEYAISLTGYNKPFEGSNLERRSRALLTYPSDSLTEWKNIEADYGQAAVLAEYIADHWSPKIITDTLNVSVNGIQSINAALARNGFLDSFADIYQSWLIANTINNANQNKKFGYDSAGLNTIKLNTGRRISLFNDETTEVVFDSVKDWQPKWYIFSDFFSGADNVLRISFDKNSLPGLHTLVIIKKKDGQQTVYKADITQGEGVLAIRDIDQISDIQLIAYKASKESGFSTNETPTPLTFTAQRVATVSNGSMPLEIYNPDSAITTQATYESPAIISSTPTPIAIHDGDLVRVANDTAIYQVQGTWRRHITDAKIFGLNQWSFSIVKEISAQQLSSYRDSRLMRSVASGRVYELDARNRRHWLKMTEAQFRRSGRVSDSIFSINHRELGFYKISSNIIK